MYVATLRCVHYGVGARALGCKDINGSFLETSKKLLTRKVDKI